jgi:hypothetical protein
MVGQIVEVQHSGGDGGGGECARVGLPLSWALTGKRMTLSWALGWERRFGGATHRIAIRSLLKDDDIARTSFQRLRVEPNRTETLT